MNFSTFIKALAPLGLITLSLTACQSSHYSYQPPLSKAAKECMQRCAVKKSRCETKNKIEYQQCRFEAIDAAKPAYRAYIKKQRAQNDAVERSLNSFADFSNCEDNYDCTSAYNECYSICGGSFRKTPG